MLANVVDIDAEAMRVNLIAEYGGLVLFYFKAAFPSTSHEYMVTVLEHVGFPRNAINFIEALYHQNNFVLRCKGSELYGLNVSSGIRQGRPLSPLLFVATMDLLLRELTARFPRSCLRAFADDTAMVTHDFLAEGAEIINVFNEFAAISGLELNLPKTAGCGPATLLAFVMILASMSLDGPA